MSLVNCRECCGAYAYQVTREIAEAFLIDYQQESKCSAETINEVKTMLQGLWAVGEKLDLLQANPFQRISKEYYISTNKEIFTPEQIDRILSESRRDPDLHAVVVVALSTGIRLTDCCGLEWSSVQLAERLILVPAQKKKKMQPAKIPFFGLLEELILRARDDSGASNHVFPVQDSFTGKPPPSTSPVRSRPCCSALASLMTIIRQRRFV